MRTKAIKTSLVIILSIIPLALSDCKKENDVSKDYVILDVTTNSEWDYWVIAKDGSNFLVQEDNLKPVSVYYQPDKNQVGFSIFFNEAGLPEKAVIQGNIILFDNFRSDYVDAALIDTEGKITFYRDLETEIDLSLYELKSKEIEMTFFEFLKVTDLSVGVASCLIALIPSGPIQAIGAIGCAATILELIAEGLPEDFEIFGLTATGIEAFINAVGCIGGFDPTDCLEAVLLTGFELTMAAHEDLMNNKMHTDLASSILRGDKFTDMDNNVYTSMQIGEQIWMKENLRTTSYNDGSSIPNITNISQWRSLTTGAYSWYQNNETANKEPYGALYNWYAVNTGKLCPTGWHVPSDAEWKQLEMHLGMSQATADQTQWRGAPVGGMLKETGTTHWQSPNTGATNETGFTGVPSGIRWSISSDFSGIYANSAYWTSTSYNTTTAWYRALYWDRSTVCRADDPKWYGFPVRCIKD